MDWIGCLLPAHAQAGDQTHTLRPAEPHGPGRRVRPVNAEHHQPRFSLAALRSACGPSRFPGRWPEARGAGPGAQPEASPSPAPAECSGSGPQVPALPRPGGDFKSFALAFSASLKRLSASLAPFHLRPLLCPIDGGTPTPGERWRTSLIKG